MQKSNLANVKPAIRWDRPAGDLAGNWSRQDAIDLYGVDRWGLGYFGVSERGNVVISAPTGEARSTIDLTEIIQGLKMRGLKMPVMLRIENLLSDRLDQLTAGFQQAFEQENYQGSFRGVFPIKVNQQSQVIREMARSGDSLEHGFEAGSKAELLIALSTLPNKNCLIVCNGYKDEEFVDLGLQAQRMGYQCFFVVETIDEVNLILKQSRHWGIEPLLGVRLKLSTKVEGHWKSGNGDRSLFGLNTRQLIGCVDALREAGMLGSLQMVHFHLGSQIPNIRNLRDGVAEACRFYVDLANEGAQLGYLNLGGGLAVDYDGTRSTGTNSCNYDLQEFCADVVNAIMESLDPHQMEHPTIVTESGRWTVAPMSVLMFNILGVSHFDPQPIPQLDHESLSEPVQRLLENLENIKLARLQENYNDAVYDREQLHNAFRSGEVDLRERALGENVCLTILHRIAELVPEMSRPPKELVGLADSLSDIYYGNFSVFQSLPDAWAINQIFPVMPLQRLDERPTRRAIIADLTCDCDGKIDRFIDAEGKPATTLPLHELADNEEYYIGVFLVGAYQETLGDLHNLFGDTHVASVRISDKGEIEFTHELNGDSVADVLSYVEYQPNEMFARFRRQAETAVREGKISVEQRQEILSLFMKSLRGYTYFKSP